mgnify:CR=1 FL=1
MKQKRTLALLLTGVMTLSALAMTGCGGGTEETAEGGSFRRTGYHLFQRG